MRLRILNKTLFVMSLLTACLVSGTAIMLTPACGQARAADNDSIKSVFKYREIYLPEGVGENATKLGLNTLEEDWGIWGHNLGRVLPEDHSQNVYAKINGVTNKKQFCFSSNHLFQYIEEYVSDKYGDEETIRFAIIPNDNEIVCLCEKCVTVGNSKKDASPAVTKLVRRLAERFPNHIFYTSDYKTTRGLPKDSMPENTGVLVSAIDFPLSYTGSPEETRFIQRLQAWKATTPRILVWDYINNFDDYFTPYPTFGAMQRRLKDYRDNNVTAVFLNGSGTDISAMSKLRTEVLAAMTSDPETDWKDLLYKKASEYYPVSGLVIADFMVAQEDDLAKSGLSLPLYEGVEKALKTYLSKDKFIDFHNKLLELRPHLTNQEKEEVEQLLGELALTRLELNRINANLDDSQRFLEDLQNLVAAGNPSYNESGWSIEGYVNDYKYLLDHYKATGSRNKLKGANLVALTPLDPDYSDISILTDGVLGIPSNYHNGNLIISPESYSKIAVPNIPGIKKLKVWLTYNPAYRLSLPMTVELSANNKKIAEAEPKYPSDLSGHTFVEFDVPSSTEGTLQLTFFKDEETRSIAIDEIEGF